MMGRQSVMRAMMMGVALAAAVTITVPAGTAIAASSVVAVVNNTPITTGDLERRVNFLRLQRTKGNLRSVAREQLIEDALKREEILRARASVSTTEVDAAYARFASSNKMSPEQLGKVLNQAGVGPEHFKQFIALQMSWPRVVNARFGRGSGKSLIERMHENGGKKPVTTEYFLKQVIFVVPEKRRNAILGKRKAEAEASRSKFPGCDQAKVFAATMHDVSIRDLGRVLAPEMPEDWKPLIEKAKGGQTTGTRVTERGVEYLAICKQREVNDDVAAEMVFRAEDLAKQKGGEDDANSKKYVAELRKKATITER